MGPTASKIIFFDVSSQYWSQVPQIRCVGPTFCPSWKSYESQKVESLNWKYGPKNGTNSILDHIFRYFQFILVLTLSYQVCWSHFLAFCEKRLVAFPKRTKSGTNTPDLRLLGPILVRNIEKYGFGCCWSHFVDHISYLDSIASKNCSSSQKEKKWDQHT